VVEEAARGKGGQSPWLGDSQEVLVSVEDRVGKGNIRLIPRRPSPEKLPAGLQHIPRGSPDSIQENFPPLQPFPPHRFTGMEVAPGKVAQDRHGGSLAVHALSVFKPVVQRQFKLVVEEWICDTARKLSACGPVWSSLTSIVDYPRNVISSDSGKPVDLYGWRLLRPKESAGFDNPFSPVKLDRLIEANGAQSIPWPSKLECCGSPLLGVNDKLSME
jgi:hypothetical protein